MIEGLQAIRENNQRMIDEMNKVVDEEEKADDELRKTYGETWNRLPSKNLNGPLKF